MYLQHGPSPESQVRSGPDPHLFGSPTHLVLRRSVSCIRTHTCVYVYTRMYVYGRYYSTEDFVLTPQYVEEVSQDGRGRIGTLDSLHLGVHLSG